MPKRRTHTVHPNDEKILCMGAVQDAVQGYIEPPDVDDLLQHFQSAVLAYNKHNMHMKECRRPCGKIVTHITMLDTGKTVLVTVENAQKQLIRVLEVH